MSAKVGRNDLCPCGSGLKFKKCHRNSQSEGPAMKEPWQSPEFQAKAWAFFDGKMAAEKNRREQFGEVRPIIHTNAWGKKLVSVGNTSCSLDPNANCSDFLREDLRVALGPEWWAGEMSKPLIGRHP